MALDQCPHMTAVCPHRRDDCKDDASKDCIYISQTASAALTALSTGSGLRGMDAMRPGEELYLRQMETLYQSILESRFGRQ